MACFRRKPELTSRNLLSKSLKKTLSSGFASRLRTHIRSRASSSQPAWALAAPAVVDGGPSFPHRSPIGSTAHDLKPLSPRSVAMGLTVGIQVGGGTLAGLWLFSDSRFRPSTGALDLGDLGGKAVLIVNVASRCGLTPQYEGLKKLHERYRDQGFSVLGVPCNQFGQQEPGSPEEIATFCSTTYGVTFPMTEKVEVNGPGRHPLYQQLTTRPDADGQAGGRPVELREVPHLPGGGNRGPVPPPGGPRRRRAHLGRRVGPAHQPRTHVSSGP